MHAYIAWLQDDGRELSTQRLSTQEQADMQGLQHAPRRRSFLLSRLLLRQLLRTQLGTDAPVFQRAGNGRLMLVRPDWHISLSHGAGAVAAILCPAACGIDIEAPRAVALEKIAARYFSDAENAALQACVPALRPALFFRLWTLKEASVKALGLGLAGNMHKLAFDLSQPSPHQHEPAPGPTLQLWQQQYGTHFLAAAVVSPEPLQWQCQQLHTDALEAP